MTIAVDMGRKATKTNKNMQIMRVVMDTNACCAGYWHFMMLTLSTFVKKIKVQSNTQVCLLKHA